MANSEAKIKYVCYLMKLKFMLFIKNYNYLVEVSYAVLFGSQFSTSFLCIVLLSDYYWQSKEPFQKSPLSKFFPISLDSYQILEKFK